MLYTVFFILSLVALGGSIVVYFRSADRQSEENIP